MIQLIEDSAIARGRGEPSRIIGQTIKIGLDLNGWFMMEVKQFHCERSFQHKCIHAYG